MNDSHYYNESFLVKAAVTGKPAGNFGLTSWQQIATDINSVDHGSLIAMDTVEGFAIYLSSPNPKRFVVTSDRDFEAAIAEPQRHNVRYFVVPQPVGQGSADRINVLYPGMWDNGSGMAVLEKELGANFRMYRLTWTAPGG